MGADVLLTSPYPEITAMAREAAQRIGVSVLILEGALDEIMEEASRAVGEHQIKVMISRGATAAMLKQQFPELPVICIDPSEFDIIEGLAEARKCGERIGFLGSRFNQVHQRVQRISQVMGWPVASFLYGDSVEFARCIEEAYRAGIQVVLGGGNRAQEMASRRDMRWVPLIAGEQTIYDALKRAKDIVETSRREQERAEWFRLVVESSQEGIVAVDQDLRFTLFNPVAQKMFGLSEAKVLGRPANDFSYLRSLAELLQGGDRQLGDLCRTRNGTLVVNRVPVTIEGTHRGTLVTFQDVTSLQNLELHVRAKLHEERFRAKYSLEDMVYRSESMAKVVEAARRFAPTDSTVLLHGESGTGKELLAQGMHLAHPDRRRGPFVALNCAALTGTLLESELFGYEEGSFTGAKKGGRPGLFEVAHGGTIFLDEIGKMPLELQGGLLRVLQEKEIRRVGGTQMIPVNVRVIAATNVDLGRMVAAGQFREDLLYRLKVLTIHIPPLRERPEDIEELSYYYLDRYAHKYGKKVVLSRRCIKALRRCPWPGNVRQLENFIERYVLLQDEEREAEEAFWQLLQEEFKDTPGSRAALVAGEGDLNLRRMQKQIARDLLETGRFTRSQLAKHLGISRTTLWKLLNEQ